MWALGDAPVLGPLWALKVVLPLQRLYELVVHLDVGLGRLRLGDRVRDAILALLPVGHVDAWTGVACAAREMREGRQGIVRPA